MEKKIFKKPATSIADQLKLLSKRGLGIADERKAEAALSEIGYFRLREYFFPFYKDISLNAKRVFVPEANFDKILMIYDFDSRLRKITFEEVERVEILIKRVICDDLVVRHGSHWFYNAEIYTNPCDVSFLINEIKKTVKRSEKYHHIKEYCQNFNRPKLPASWMIFHLLTFGTVSKFYSNLNEVERHIISGKFGLSSEKLKNWLHVLSQLRNSCAHHERIWNKGFPQYTGIDSLKEEGSRHINRFYNHALVIRFFEKNMLHEKRWKAKLKKLLRKHSEIPILEMGFPENWEKDPIWND